MVSRDAIDAALAAHAEWKQRLHDAIATGKSEFKVEDVKRDDACSFGQWLHGLQGEDVGNEDFNKVQSLHAAFHKTAGVILELAIAGKKDLALAMMDTGGMYSGATGDLVQALQTWKGNL
jgi:hypothetical protein